MFERGTNVLRVIICQFAGGKALQNLRQLVARTGIAAKVMDRLVHHSDICRFSGHFCYSLSFDRRYNRSADRGDGKVKSAHRIMALQQKRKTRWQAHCSSLKGTLFFVNETDQTALVKRCYAAVSPLF
jgi:hypothetical protein